NAGNTTTQPITVATIDTGIGVTEVYFMNQNVRTSDTPTFTGLSAGSSRITGVATPTADTDAATKAYVDAAVAGAGGGSDIAGVRCYDLYTNDYTNKTSRYCQATCPAGYEVVNAEITCKFGGYNMGEGGVPGSWGCSKYLADTAVNSVAFLAHSTTADNKDVWGMVWCIKN
ncbi:MAG: hypothetical protein HYW81_03580, partial [Parcubacteria group bacterium]|nr:hypothetical protein [Parcubacteria group bacterium]